MNQPLTGNLVVTKTFSGPVTESDLTNLTFEIKDKNGNLLGGKTYKFGDFTVQTDGSRTLTFNDIPVGDYTVTETIKDVDGTTCTVTYTVGSTSTNDKATASVTDGATTTVAIKDDYKEKDKTISLSKVDATSKKEIEGAQLEIYASDKDGNKISGGFSLTWTSEKTVKTFTVEPGTYAIKEIVAPDGYVLCESLFVFSVEYDSTGKLVVKQISDDHLPGVYDQSGDLITFENDPIKVTSETGGMKVTVLEEGTNRKVPGATVEIKAPSGSTFPDGSTTVSAITDENGQVTEFTGKDGKTYKLTEGLTPGDYTVTVTKVPDGYKVTTGYTDTVTVKPNEVTEHTALIITSDTTDTSTNTTDTTTQTTTEKKTEVTTETNTTTTKTAPPATTTSTVDTSDKMDVLPIYMVMFISLMLIGVVIVRKRRLKEEYWK